MFPLHGNWPDRLPWKVHKNGVFVPSPGVSDPVTGQRKIAMYIDH